MLPLCTGLGKYWLSRRRPWKCVCFYCGQNRMVKDHFIVYWVQLGFKVQSVYHAWIIWPSLYTFVFQRIFKFLLNLRDIVKIMKITKRTKLMARLKYISVIKNRNTDTKFYLRNSFLKPMSGTTRSTKAFFHVKIVYFSN